MLCMLDVVSCLPVCSLSLYVLHGILLVHIDSSIIKLVWNAPVYTRPPLAVNNESDGTSCIYTQTKYIYFINGEAQHTCTIPVLTWYIQLLDVVLVVLLFYVHGKHLRSCRDGQLT